MIVLVLLWEPKPEGGERTCQFTELAQRWTDSYLGLSALVFKACITFPPHTNIYILLDTK